MSTSFTANQASWEHKRTSHAHATSTPPPMHAPCTARITGTRHPWRRVRVAWRERRVARRRNTCLLASPGDAVVVEAPEDGCPSSAGITAKSSPAVKWGESGLPCRMRHRMSAAGRGLVVVGPGGLPGDRSRLTLPSTHARTRSRSWKKLCVCAWWWMHGGGRVVSVVPSLSRPSQPKQQHAVRATAPHPYPRVMVWEDPGPLGDANSTTHTPPGVRVTCRVGLSGG